MFLKLYFYKKAYEIFFNVIYLFINSISLGGLFINFHENYILGTPPYSK
jgi:hypothetical protein